MNKSKVLVNKNYQTPSKINSPLTNSLNVVLEEEVSSELIIKLYQTEYQVDVEKYFEGVNSIKIYKCLDTNYRFYYPFHLSGDSNFYEELQKLPWYYSDWKWEHQVADTFINSNDSVLEIGCAQGGFIEKLQQRGVTCAGLEFNEDAVRVGQDKGLNILNQSVEEHAQLNPEKYDIVCSFQVLEHVSLVKSFMDASLKALKPSGQLIIGVPNNNPFIFKYDKYHTLNMPPHHMGLWNKNSLLNLQKFFNIRVDSIEVESLQKWDYELYYNLHIRHLKSQSELLGQVVDKILQPFSKKMLLMIGKYIQGRNILAVYTKLG